MSYKWRTSVICCRRPYPPPPPTPTAKTQGEVVNLSEFLSVSQDSSSVLPYWVCCFPLPMTWRLWNAMFKKEPCQTLPTRNHGSREKVGLIWLRNSLQILNLGAILEQQKENMLKHITRYGTGNYNFIYIQDKITLKRYACIAVWLFVHTCMCLMCYLPPCCSPSYEVCSGYLWRVG